MQIGLSPAHRLQLLHHFPVSTMQVNGDAFFFASPFMMHPLMLCKSKHRRSGSAPRTGCWASRARTAAWSASTRGSAPPWGRLTPPPPQAWCASRQPQGSMITGEQASSCFCGSASDLRQRAAVGSLHGAAAAGASASRSPGSTLRRCVLTIWGSARQGSHRFINATVCLQPVQAGLTAVRPRAGLHGGLLGVTSRSSFEPVQAGEQLTAVRFDDTGLGCAVGTSGGLVALFDLRAQKPLVVKDHMNGQRITDIKFHAAGHDGSIGNSRFVHFVVQFILVFFPWRRLRRQSLRQAAACIVPLLGCAVSPGCEPHTQAGSPSAHIAVVWRAVESTDAVDGIHQCR